MARTVLKLSGTILAVCASALHAQAATITAASTAQRDVAAAVASAQDGDTVVIPAGNSTWTSALTITKAITLQGQGIGKTFWRRHQGFLNLQPTNNKPIRVTGIYFDMSPYSGSDGDRPAINFYGTCTSLRIDHCYFLCGERAVYLHGIGYGVVDHCTFRNNYISLMPSMSGSDGGSNSWAQAIKPGDINTLVVEDCTFLCDQPGGSSGFIESDFYGQNGARCCIRHCNFDYTGTGLPFKPGDAHGYSPSWGNGTRFYEIYNNVFHCKYTYRFAYLRGGTQIWHDNQFIRDNAGSPPLCMGLTRESVGYSSGQQSTKQLITQSFFWNNTLSVGGGAANSVGAAPAGTNPNEPVLNRDYFNRPIKSGDPWYPYTPLVYPHPRVTADNAGKPAPVGNLRVIASSN
jgi:hypothetical protein